MYCVYVDIIHDQPYTWLAVSHVCSMKWLHDMATIVLCNALIQWYILGAYVSPHTKNGNTDQMTFFYVSTLFLYVSAFLSNLLAQMSL